MTEEDINDLKPTEFSTMPGAAAEPSREDRAKALVAEFEHAAKHNAPVTPAMIKELRAVMLGE